MIRRRSSRDLRGTFNLKVRLAGIMPCLWGITGTSGLGLRGSWDCTATSWKHWRIRVGSSHGELGCIAYGIYIYIYICYIHIYVYINACIYGCYLYLHKSIAENGKLPRLGDV